jgi:hypothetical protein
VKTQSRALDKILLPVLLFLVSFALYEPRCALTPQESDGGEYATAAVTGSIVHEPGYPVYMAIARSVITFFEPENPYYAMALFSTVCQSLAVALLFLVLRRLNLSYPLSFLAALAWGMYAPVFRVATDVEVFALHNLFLSLSLYIGLSMTSIVGALAYGLALGLAAAHHQTIILWAPVFIYLGFSAFKGKTLIFALFLAILGLAFGLSSYLTLMTVHVGKPILAFSPPETFQELYNYILRAGYGTFRITAQGGEPTESYIWHFLESAVLNIPFAYFGLITPIFFLVFNRTWQALAWTLVAVLHWAFLALIIFPGPIELIGEVASRFYGLVAFAGVVLAGYIIGTQKISAVMEFFFGFVILVAFMVVFPGVLQYADSRRDKIFDYESKQLLTEITPGGILIAQSDRVAMATLYQSLALKHRPDVVTIIKAMLKQPAYRRSLGQRDPIFKGLPAEPMEAFKVIVERANEAGRKVFTEVGGATPEGMFILPIGVAWQVVTKEQGPPLDEVTKRIVSFCVHWPEHLKTPGRARRATRALLGQIFLWPIDNHASLTTNPEVGSKLLEAKSAFIRGDIKAAREVCTEAYGLLLPEFTGEIPYPQPY